MITANALICGKKIQLIVIKIISLGYIVSQPVECLLNIRAHRGVHGACCLWDIDTNQEQQEHG
ncbi:hypothetical protein [Symbiopectobacterium sp. RP]|uniref:hypothetical protein n=1 Tax=Symbiopectobacterium sp. RP TaxID=3248553 RepID=UPI003D2DF8B8